MQFYFTEHQLPNLNKVVYLFVVFFMLRSPKPQWLLLCSWYVEKPLMSQGALSWLHNVLTNSGEAIEY